MSSRFQLYIIRHAQSANNALPESQRVDDPSITEAGKQQAQCLAERFRDIPITHAVTSAFLRAVQTMQPLTAAVGVRPAIWTDLHEVGGCYAGFEPGKLEGRPGMNRETLQSRFPEFTLSDDIEANGWWKSRPYEENSDAQQRAERQAKALLCEWEGTNARVACVIHADFKDLLLHAILKSAYEPYRSADLRNTGVTLLSCGKEEIDVLEFNDVSHLPDELTTS